MKLDKSTKIQIIVFITAIIVLLSVPLIIEYINPLYITAGEALTFCGGILGASVAIFGVYLTLKQNQIMIEKQLKMSEEINKEIIKDNQEKFEEERRLSVLPYITINKIGIDEYFAKRSIESEAEEAIKIYNEELHSPDYSILLGQYKLTEYPIEEIIACFIEGQVVFLTHFKKEDTDIIQSGPKIVNNEKKYSYLYKPYILSNAGIGTAVDLTVLIYELKPDNNDSIRFKLPFYSMHLSLSQGRNCKISFFSKSIDYVDKHYHLEVQYFDIYEHLYRQNFKLYFDRDDNFFRIDAETQELVIVNKLEE